MTEPAWLVTGAQMHGILVVDKPAGPTSHDVVAWARRAFGQRQVGHCGTLDPAATGVLVIALGEATKLVSLLSSDDKEYEGVVQLGSSTSSGDADGAPTGSARVPALSRGLVESALEPLLGERRQRPPAISAIKVGGVALHRRVRRGEVVEVPERDVVVRELDLLELEPEGARLGVRVRCGKGFYVRALAVEIAAQLGTLGHLVSLRRTRSGAYTLAGALPGSTLRRAAAGEPGALAEAELALLPLDRAVSGLPRLVVSADEAQLLRHGRPLAIGAGGGQPGIVCAVAAEGGWPVALVRTEGESWCVVRGFRPLGARP